MGYQPYAEGLPARQPGDSLADVLERVLDRGIVIAGDIQINLLDIELLTIKLRLLVASVDKAKEMGIDWWESDPALNKHAQSLEEENERLRDRLEALEQDVARLDAVPDAATERPVERRERTAERAGSDGSRRRDG